MAQQFSQQPPKGPTLGHRPGAGRDRFVPTAKPKNARGTMLRIIRLYLRWAKTIFIAILLTVISSLIAVAIPFYIGKTFNTFHIVERSVDTSKLVSLLIIILCLIGS